MQCSQHPENTATAYCTNCGKAVCDQCRQVLDSRILCVDCASQFVPPPPLDQPAVSQEAATTSLNSGIRSEQAPFPSIPIEKGYPYCAPGVCFVLGLIPGVGGICNGDYLKAFVQVLIFGTLVSLAGSGEAGQFGPVLMVLAIAFYLYMPLEAYHVSKKRTLALKGIMVMTPFDKFRFSEIWAGVLAVALGTIFLVNQYLPGTLHFILRGWPLLLIALGVFNLARYFRSSAST
jgi:hypothetical protein